MLAHSRDGESRRQALERDEDDGGEDSTDDGGAVAGDSHGALVTFQSQVHEREAEPVCPMEERQGDENEKVNPANGVRN